MHIEFPNTKVIVTGAAHGFGRAISLAFAQRGAEVWSCDVQADELQETQALYFERGAEEVWICNTKGAITFFDPQGKLTQSQLVPTFPQYIEL